MSKLIDGFFFSSLIGKDLRYRAIVPNEARKSNAVLYLLHGLFGSAENWTELTRLQEYAEHTDLIIAMPDGGDNWYTDSEEQYESFLIHDLLPEIEGRFGAPIDRNGRAIAGNSMGGYGALKIALKYPDLFGFAASFSGAFHVTRFLPGMDGGELAPSILRVFGDKDSSVRNANDIFTIAAAAAKAGPVTPRIYFDCGLDDPFIDANREFASALSAARIEYEFSELEGGHDWLYWDQRIAYLIQVLGQ
ncbi:MAG: alpha/beta hydrolase family protein [Pyrinomonadaceae bacterium]